ncbi:group II truncated hemoglobin [Xanthobacter sp. V0B-10]|uniref:group II truncated hemoglobin n=1 Tax=Xanthobacter albus TaxID=3119929 RepID=UPI00372B5EF0
MSDAADTPSMYERIGGAVAIDRLVEEFYARMDHLPEAREIRLLHAPDLTPLKGDLKRYLTEWTGGPRLYSPQKGHPRMRQRHMHVPIGAAERDAWLLCMRGALDQTVADPAARDELYGAMARLADWMRNTGDNPHDTAGHAARP